MAKYIHPSNSKGVKKQNRVEDPEGQRDHRLRMVNLSMRCLGDKRHMHADSWAQVVLIKCLITTTHLTELSEFKVSVLETRRRQWHPTAVLLPGKSHGWRSLVGAVCGVTKSWTRLSGFTLTFHFHALEKEMATHSSVFAWRIPGTGEPGGLLSMESHRVGHD